MRLTLTMLAAIGLALPACSTTAERMVMSDAYEACKSRSGESFERCIAQEEDAGRLEMKERNERCQQEIDDQAERRAMIKGWRTGDPTTEAAEGC